MTGNKQKSITKLSDHKKLVKILLVIGCASATVSGCGKKDLGASLSIAISPESAFILPGKAASCYDKRQAKLTGTIETQSITEYRVNFNNFALKWESNETLFVVRIKVTITGSGLSGKAEIVLSSDEIDALLGVSGGKILRADTPINSNDANKRNSSSSFVACGLQVGGIAVSSASATFTARVTIQVDAYSQNSAGEQSPVRQTTTASAQFL